MFSLSISNPKLFGTTNYYLLEGGVSLVGAGKGPSQGAMPNDTPLHKACHNGEMAEVKRLIESGEFDVNEGMVYLYTLGT